MASKLFSGHAENAVGTDDDLEAAVRRILDAGLGTGRSVIEPDLAAWLPDMAGDMRRRIVDNTDFGEGTFLGKLKIQLDGAHRATYLLTAELLYVQAAPLWNLTGSKKRERIRSVLSWLQPLAQLPPDLATALGMPGVVRRALVASARRRPRHRAARPVGLPRDRGRNARRPARDPQRLRVRHRRCHRQRSGQRGSAA